MASRLPQVDGCPPGGQHHQNEHPQIQTIVLSYLEPEQSAEILSQFPEQVRLDLW